MSLSSVGVIPYRRLTDPIRLAVNTTSTRTAVPQGFIPPEATSFRVTNPNAFWVRLRGANDASASSLTISDQQGWLFPPGFSGTFTSQFPTHMATIAVGTGAGAGTLEISYGVGASGESVAALMAAGGQAANTGLTDAQLRASPVPVSGFPATQAVIDRGSGSIATGRVSVVQNVAVQVVGPRATRRKVILAPAANNFAYFVGNSDVTTSTGTAVLAGGSITIDTTGAVFVVSGANGVMTFMEMFG